VYRWGMVGKENISNTYSHVHWFIGFAAISLPSLQFYARSHEINSRIIRYWTNALNNTGFIGFTLIIFPVWIWYSTYTLNFYFFVMTFICLDTLIIRVMIQQIRIKQIKFLFARFTMSLKNFKILLWWLLETSTYIITVDKTILKLASKTNRFNCFWF